MRRKKDTMNIQKSEKAAFAGWSIRSSVPIDFQLPLTTISAASASAFMTRTEPCGDTPRICEIVSPRELLQKPVAAKHIYFMG